MPVPPKIRISRIEEYHTDTLGRFGTGSQFMAFTLWVLPPDRDRGWEERRNLFVVLHLFDAEGNHVETRAWNAGTAAEDGPALSGRADAKLDAWLNELPDRRLEDVEVKLFTASSEGVLFGLVDGTYTEDGRTVERIELVPNDIVFSEPWDGSYDT